MIVEDNLVNNKVFTQIVKSEYDYICAFNGKEALDIIDKGILCDLILMDIQMPIMDGLEATQEIRKRGLKLPIIAVTASVDQQNCDQCLTAGMNDFLSKPVTKTRVLSILKKWI